MLDAELTRLRRRALWLEGMSMAWTVAAVAIGAGVLASSIALIGLGLESVIVDCRRHRHLAAGRPGDSRA